MRRRILSILLAVSLLMPSMPVMAAEVPIKLQEESSLETIVETLIESSPEVSAETPLQIPTEAPAETPSQIPAEIPEETPSQIPAEISEETPSELPAEASPEVPAGVPTLTPTIEPTAVLSAEPTESPTSSPLPEEELVGASGGAALTDDSSANFTNLVVFVEFQDTKDVHSAHTNTRACMWDTKYDFKLFDGDGRYGSEQSRRSLKRYLDTISYGELRVANIIPQFNGTAIVPLQLSGNSGSYSVNSTNSTLLIQDTIKELQNYDFMGANLDRWMKDGCLDNLAIVVAAGGADFVAHKEFYEGPERIGGVRVRNCTILPEKDIYLGMEDSGVIIHEFLHVLGYPDLYRKRESTGQNTPVGRWDIMASVSMCPQYPLAWLRSDITGWFAIPTVRSSMTGCSLYAASAATAATKDRQALILKTDYSDTEFFVVEYRKLGERFSDELEGLLPGSGLIIYRVNTRYKTNVGGFPDMIYVFRPEDTYDNDGNEYGDGEFYDSFLSAESGRTSYGSADSEMGLYEGAITYADGSNSGIVISNVGSAGGDQITFDITFSDNGNYWTPISSEQDNSDASIGIASWLDTDGTMYYLQTKLGNSTYLYSYKSSWNRLAAAPAGWYHQLVGYKGSLYAAYLDKSFYVRLARWTGTGWENIPLGQYPANEVSMAVGTGGVYVSWVNTSNNGVYVCKYDGSRVKKLGSMAGSESGAANPMIAADGENVAVMYRLYTSNDRLLVKHYDKVSDTWREIPDEGLAGSGVFRIDGGRIYILKNDRISGEDYGLCVYTYDLNRNSGIWEQLGNRIFIKGNSVEMDICFQEGQPYIAFMEGRDTKFDTSVMHLVGGQWRQLGSKVADSSLQGLRIYSIRDEIWATYCTGVDAKRAYIKSHSSERPQQPMPTGRPVVPTAAPSPEASPTATPSQPVTPASPTPQPTAPVPTANPTPSLPLTWPFVDVAVQPGGWKYESVKFVYENGIMNGITQTDGTVNTFEPDAPLTRGMFATVLYRMAGSPAVVFENRFTDVKAGIYYSNAVIWAYQEGIVNGYADGSYGVGDYITREQIAKMLMEYADRKKYDISIRADLNGFPDASGVSGWAVKYMQWAVGSGMINGKKNFDGYSYLDARGNATRAECATMLTRFIQKYQ